VGQRLARPPRIFSVNWFRRGPDGKFLWPGYGENMRVLKWVIDRCRGRAGAVESALGWMPRAGDLEWTGLDPGVRSRYGELMSIDRELWVKELARHQELLSKLGDKLPKDLARRRDLLLSALQRSPERWTVPD
jgi:phosphoenolpyruvate carboxykinase (GTP)